MTRFERITESPEALAALLGKVTWRCASSGSTCRGCPIYDACNDGWQKLAEWLKEEE